MKYLEPEDCRLSCLLFASVGDCKSPKQSGRALHSTFQFSENPSMVEAKVYTFPKKTNRTFGAVGGLDAVVALEVGGTINEEGEDKDDVGVLLRGSTAVDPKGEIPGKPGGLPPKPANKEFGPPIFG